MTDITRTTRAGGRGARRALRSAPDFDMLPSLKRGLPECEVMDPARVEQIDDASMSILEEVGVIFRDEIARNDRRRVGAKVVGDRVYLDRGLVRDLIATIPSAWTYRARNPRRAFPSEASTRSSSPRPARPSSATSTTSAAGRRSPT